MIRLQYHWIVALFLAISAGSFAQSSTSAQRDPATAATSAVGFPSASIANVGGTYAFPDERQQFRNYLYATFGPPALISTAVGAG